jgi:hypothetical protein
MGNNVIVYNGPSFSNGEFSLDADAYFGVSNNFMGTTNASNVSYYSSMKFNWGFPGGDKTILFLSGSIVILIVLLLIPKHHCFMAMKQQVIIN